MRLLLRFLPRWIPSRFWLLSVLLVALNVVGLLWIRHEWLAQRDAKSEPLRVVSALPAENVDQAERLSLVFNRPVGDAERLNQQLEEALPFDVSPRPSGRWTWVSPKRLDFMLDDPLPPGKTFRVTPASGIETQLGQVVQVSGEIAFQTRALALTDCRLVSSDESHVTFELKFNQPVAPNELLQALLLSDQSGDEDSDHPHDAAANASGAGESVIDPFSATPATSPRFQPVSLVNEPSDSIVLRCPRPESNRLIVRINPRLTGHDADRPLGTAVRRELKISPVFGFLRTEVSELGIDDFFQIHLYFTSPLDGDQNLPPLELSPSVKEVASEFVGAGGRNGRILRLKGEFEAGRRYRLQLPATLLAKTGKTLGRKTRVTFDVPDRRPRVEFSEYRGILSPHGNLQVDLRTLNVGGVKIRASRLHANNLVPHLHGQGRRRTSIALAEKSFRFEQTRNESVSHTLELRKLLKEPLGLYQISADATDANWTRDSAVISVTDLGLSLKQHRKAMHVWVTSLRHATTLGDVRVSSVSYNNQVLASGTTNKQGMVELPVDPDHPDGRPWVIIAESKTETAWLRTDRGHWVIGDVDQSGRSPSENYDVLLYCERGTYRPGDVIHLSGIIRDNAGKTPPPFPLAIQVIRPDGHTVATKTVQAAAEADGAFHFDWKTSATAWTGPWRFRIRILGDEQPLAETHAYVEDFIPVRLKVKAEPAQPLFMGGEVPRIDVTARYLFGTPASGLQVRAAGEFRAVRFRSKQHPDFRFGPLQLGYPADADSQGEMITRFEPKTIEAQLDAAGCRQIEFTGQTPQANGLWRGSFSVTVTEDGGRSVSTHADFQLDTLQRHLGLRMKSRNIVPVGEDINVDWTVQTASDEPAEFAPVQFELLRVEFDNVLRRDVFGHSTWESIEKTESVWQHSVVEAPDDEIGRTAVNCPKPGIYRLIAVDSRTQQRTVLQFHAVKSDASNVTTALDRPERLNLKLDKTKYRPGDTARVVVSGPFAGRLWLALESDRVLWSTVMQLEKNSAVVQVPIPPDVRGGVYLSASVVRPVDPTQAEWLPHRARGIAYIATDHSDHVLPIEFDVRASAEPRELVTVSVQTQPDAMVHIWAVDEGILATSGFELPSPHGHFFARRRDDVTTSDVFSQLLPDHRRPATFHRIGAGGGGEAENRLRRNPVPARQREAAVVWSTFQKAGADGRLTKSFTLPDMTGELHWMAVAVSGDRYGSTESPMTVTSPLLVEATWPRFAAPGDEFRVPAKLFNTTDESLRVTLATTIDGPLTVQDGDAKINIAARSSQIVWLKARAVSIGPVEGTIQAAASLAGGTKLTSASRFALPIRPATALETDRQFLTLKAGQRIPIETDPRFMTQAIRTRVTVSAQAGLVLKPAVDQLLRYPYGCVEQSTSRLRGILAARSWLSTTDAADAREVAISEMLAAGVSRLWSMQTRRGGFSYWPGNIEPHLWGTTYAAETLLDIRDAGYPVDKRLLAELKQFLKTSLQHFGSGANSGSPDLNTVADICCVLSRLDAPPTGWMSRLTERVADLDMAGRAQLARAWLQAGRRDRAQQSLPDDTIDLPGSNAFSGRFVSDSMQRARLLKTLLELQPDHAWIPRLVNQLHQARQNGRWLSTLENALIVEALSAHQATSGDQSLFSGRVTVGMQTFQLEPGTTRVVELKGSDKSIAIAPTAKGQVFATIETTGLTKDPVKEQDRVIRVRRRWLDRKGKSIDPQDVRVGDLIVVEVTLRATGHASVASVAVVDALPAGLEVENPRLRTSDSSQSNSGGAERVEFLDDRVILFATASARGTKFCYALRAVTPGKFTVPPIQASCMYNESIASVSGAGRLVVSEAAKPSGPVASDPNRALKK